VEPGQVTGAYVQWHAMNPEMAEAYKEVSKNNAESERHKAEAARQTFGVPATEERKRDTWKTATIGGVVLVIVIIGTAALERKDLLTFYLSCTGILAGAWGVTEIFKKKPPALPPSPGGNDLAK
jgi:hypothetical protein